MQPNENIRILPASALAQVHKRQELIEQQKLIVAALEGDLERFVAQVAGVDTQNEHWSFDPKEGILVRYELPPSPEAPAEAPADNAQGNAPASDTPAPVAAE